MLRKDGVVFWNIGDSYWGSGRGYGSEQDPKWIARQDKYKHKPDKIDHPILKPKDLCLIPFRVAIAAQNDGWWVRSIIIWSKPNPMPESVTDRPTESHEYILMLTKSARYYWDADAVREPHTDVSILRAAYESRRKSNQGWKSQVLGSMPANEVKLNPNGRNIRTVWESPTQPYPEAHFAVFPEALPERCIMAATKSGDLVLDPFMGAGTTLWVAKKLGRKAVGYDLSEEYVNLAIDRCRQMVMELV